MFKLSKQKPEYWNILGSSKSRTGEQEQMSREIIGGMLDSCEDGTAVVFTDGSCLGNPGPCGAGACIFHPGTSEPVLLKQPVSSRGSTLPGFALGFIFLSPPFSPIRFFCAIFSNLEPDFGHFSPKKSQVCGGIFRKKCLLSLTPLILVDYCTHIDKITKEWSILYLKRLIVFKFMYICTWRLLIFLNKQSKH